MCWLPGRAISNDSLIRFNIGVMKQNRFPVDRKTTEPEPRSLPLTTAANLGNSQYEWHPTAGNPAALRAIRHAFCVLFVL